MKILDNGIAIVETDSHIGRWIQESGRIDHDLTVQDQIVPMFSPDWVVIDVGADVGSHTVPYAKAAAQVLAFEPNPEEFNCLVWNCRSYPNVTCLPIALSSIRHKAGLITCENAGAGHLSTAFQVATGPVTCLPLDAFPFERLDFIKIDVEGFEPFVLEGAKHTIRRFRPIILLEMNAGALARYGKTYQTIFEDLSCAGYSWRSFAQDCDLLNTEQYDLLATPTPL